MDTRVRRLYVEKKKGFDVEAHGMYRDLKNNLGIKGLEGLRIIHRYDVSGISDAEFAKSRNTIFSEPPVDLTYEGLPPMDPGEKFFAVEYLPGQYDQRADSASQCIQMLTLSDRPQCKAAKLIALKGNISEEDYLKIKDYCINPVESHEASLEIPETLEVEVTQPEQVKTIEGFTGLDEEGIKALWSYMGLAMSVADLAFCRDYFKDVEKRDPTITEIRLIDTYWSDHCRHTTFLTSIENVEFDEGQFSNVIKKAFDEYIQSRKFVHGDREEEKDVSLMDLATIGAKELKKKGMVQDLDISDEINACSIVVNAKVNGVSEDWLVMFKNETHNHPTEIEPFGGAATCLGGAIRDPLSGRSYVYQAMRVTGSGDPRTPVAGTIPGKLPQRKITTGAATGYSSYGNQIGLSTGQVTEIYDDGFVAKRMEIGAVIGAVPKRDVVREKPKTGDIIILLGGRTGRDGCGGATGSSKEHTEESLLTCGAEVQKGNPPTERKIQRLFRNPAVSRMIKKCNDFGAGGVSVAIGELADGLKINLDAVPKKYEGLDGTELAISESQERMAVVVSAADAQAFIELAGEENLEASVVAEVTEEARLRMSWRDTVIVDISREFLDTNGVKQTANARVTEPSKDKYTSETPEKVRWNPDRIKEIWLSNLSDLNVCSQKGLVERFDSTIGAGSVLMPFGGRYQLSPAEGMAAKLPVLEGDTDTCTLMTFGYDPAVSRWSPFHGAVTAVVEAVARITAMGGDYTKVRLSFQEYFEKLGRDPEKWGKPLSALLGAYMAQHGFGIPAIGGKDSMSGTFMDLNVPPTLVAFAVCPSNAGKVVSSEFKKAGSRVVFLKSTMDENQVQDFAELGKTYKMVHKLASEGRILSASSVRHGGMAAVLSKMCFGNMLGFEFTNWNDPFMLFTPCYGSLILELDENSRPEDLLQGVDWTELGITTDEKEIKVNGRSIGLDEMLTSWQKPLEGIFPTKAGDDDSDIKSMESFSFSKDSTNVKGNVQGKSSGNIQSSPRAERSVKTARPRIFIPVFPGTNCEYDTAKAFEKAGGQADVLVLRNLTPNDIGESIRIMMEKIQNSQIIIIPGGFSAGDEPEGSGKFIATAFRNPYISEAVMDLLKNRDGLMLGICNGFQALIKLGLVPYGEIRDMKDDSPTLTYNSIGRHVSCMVNTRISSNLSPWFSNVNTGDIHTIAVSHGEGRFVAREDEIRSLAAKGQIATQYVDLNGNVARDIRYNPNGSMAAIEGITSPDGRVLGKMGHSERIGSNVVINVPGEKDQKLFEAGVGYFL